MSYRIADLFCGAGGTSTGAVEALQALGHRAELTAVNHWPRAIETHTANHPDARHLCACLDSLNPQEVFPDRKLNLLWASPSCVMFSTARDSSAPLDDGIRASPWCVVRWADSLRPDSFMVENVPAFRNWGPLDSKGRPFKKRKGETFRAWIAALESLGYKVDHRVFCAADFGDPTTRDRFALIKAEGGDVLFRMVRWRELAAAQGFRYDYKFTGTVQEVTKQIGNAVPRNTARALVLAAVGQSSDVTAHMERFAA